MFPIDIVYTWVDGDDQNHVTCRKKYQDGVHKATESIAPFRWRNSNELKYSIESIQKFAPWVRYIFVITSFHQRPLFHLPSNVRIIDDVDLFGTYCNHLPVFNSHSIEVHLHRIEELSEHFIYLCDDMFFGSSVSPLDFFTFDGRICIFQGGEILPKGKPTRITPGWLSARMNNSTVLDRYFKFVEERRDCLHQARPVLKSLFVLLWDSDEIRSWLIATSKAKFRSHDNVEMVGLVSQVAIYLNEYKYKKISSKYINLIDKKNPVFSFRSLLKKQPKLYCINDTLVTSNPSYLQKLQYCFENLLPHNYYNIDQE